MPLHALWDQPPVRSGRPKAPVATAGLKPVPAAVSCIASGDVAKSPAWTVRARPGSFAWPTVVQREPSVEVEPVRLSPERTSRSQRGDSWETLPEGPALSCV